MKLNQAMLKFVKLGITIIIALVIIYFTVSLSLICFDFGYRVFTEPAMEAEPGTDIVVTIDSSMGAMKIGQELEDKGLVRDGKLFMIQLMLSVYMDGEAPDITPGTYILNTSMDSKDMMIVMSDPEKNIAAVEDETESEEESDSKTETETESATEKVSGT